MRVLHLVKTGVGATWALWQMAELRRLGVDVHVAMPDGPQADRYRSAGVVVHLAELDFPMSEPRLIPKRVRACARLVDQLRPDVVHSHFVGTTLTMRIALGRNHRVPRIFQVPGPLHLEHSFFRMMELASAGAADYWIGSCRWTCRTYRLCGVPGSRVFLSYYGTNVEEGAPQHRSEAAGRGVAVTPSSKVVGLVAYMYAPRTYLFQRRGLKGHEDLIDALDICRRQIPDLVGVFVGGAWNRARWYEERVVAYGKQRDPVRNLFLGTRQDVPDLYRQFDVAVCPSHSENVGAAVESLLFGVPTVASDVGGLPDIVQHGRTGWLVPPRNPQALAAAILDALQNEDRARAMAEQGRRLAAELFDVKRTAAEVLEVYRQILADRLAVNVTARTHRTSRAVA